MKRLLLVYNPYSSRHSNVKTEVLDRLSSLKGFIIGKFAIKKAPFRENVISLKKILKDGDIVIAAGGDATAAVTANAILESGRDVTFGVLPYGNFNDLARTLGAMKFENVIELLSCERVTATEGVPKKCHHFWGRKMTGRTRAMIAKLYPLEIIVNGKHWRFATCYATIGMTAEAVELFDEPVIRKKLQKGHENPWRSYFYLKKWYFKNRHQKQFLPEFYLNNLPQHPKISDYFAVNGRSVCRVMKGKNDYSDPKTFHSTTDRLTNFWRLIKFMTKSIFAHIPGAETTGDVLKFIAPATIEIQAEGEYQVFHHVSQVEIKKSSRYLKVFQKIRG